MGEVQGERAEWEKHWRLLLQLDTEPEIGLLFPAWGRGYFWVTDEALRSRRFDQCVSLISTRRNCRRSGGRTSPRASCMRARQEDEGMEANRLSSMTGGVTEPAWGKSREATDEDDHRSEKTQRASDVARRRIDSHDRRPRQPQHSRRCRSAPGPAPNPRSHPYPHHRPGQLHGRSRRDGRRGATLALRP